MATIPKYPGVQEKLRHLSADELHSPFFNGPPSAKDLQITCECKNVFRPPWSKRLAFEYSPMLLNLDNGEKAVFCPCEIPIPCPSCGKRNTLTIPTDASNGGSVTLYGDESYPGDDDGKRYVFVYAFVGATENGREHLKESLERFKGSVRPNIDPSTWRFHTKDVRSPEWRRKKNIERSTGELNEMMEDLAAAVATRPEDRWISITVCSVLDKTKLFNDGRDPENGVRDLVLTSAIFSAVEELTKQGFSPSFILEAVKNHTNSEYMDYFVERIGRSLFHDLGFLYSTRGKQVGLPVTRKKAYTFEMEYADFLAFWTNRFFQRQSIGKHTEIPNRNSVRCGGDRLAHIEVLECFRTLAFPGIDFFPRRNNALHGFH